MAQNEVRVAWEALQKFTKEVFVRVGMPPEDAETEASVLMWANLRGVDSHGVLRIPWYVGNVDKGIMNPKPSIKVVKETPVTMVIEADQAFGPVVTVFAMNRVMEKARQVGIGWAFICNHTHQGAMGYYSQMAAKQDMAGIVFVCSPPNMAPYGARVAGIGNSPLTIAVPAKRHRVLFLDMATSVVARGKIWLAVDRGVSIPEGWALDKDGNPTTDPSQAATFLPTSGPKGSGLALMFECLGSVMIGNPLLEPMLLGKKVEPPPPSKKPEVKGGHPDHVSRPIQNSVVAAIDISTFTDVGAYKEHIDNLIDGIKALPKAEGFSEILVPGEPEERAFDDRSRNGIPLPEGTIRNLRDVAERFGIELPSGL
ncbi:MAG: Ldh family oxidoreductase [Dehalococcoidia bacterium]|nr:MAG: Ldh family oxidoreductase [Dehalococcoidia bacterium]